MKLRRATLLVLTALLLGGAAASQRLYDSQRGYFDARRVFVTLPSGKALRVLSFGWRNFTADLLYIWAIQFYSTYHNQNRFDYIEQVFGTITDVSPQYREPYIIGALIMAYEKNDIPMALRLLEKGSAKNPQEWIFDMDAGYYSFKFLHQIDKARVYYARAAAKPEAPVFLKRNQAHLVYLENNLDQAWQMWLEIYRNPKDIISRDAAFSHLYQIKAEKDIARLQDLVARFRTQYRRLPRSLQELATRGLLAAIPTDFAGQEYRYDPAGGHVSARMESRWKHSW
jgi:hypothetical protein